MDSDADSLIDRAMARLSPPQRPRFAFSAARPDWRVALAISATIALGPLLTIAGARLIEASARADTARILNAAAPRLQAIERDAAARRSLASAVAAVSTTQWFDRVAQVLPADARIARMKRDRDGALQIDITTPDPDRLRAALRRSPAMAGFREAGQERSGALMLVRWRKTA